MKKILSIMLVICMLCSVVSLIGFTASAETTQDKTLVFCGTKCYLLSASETTADNYDNFEEYHGLDDYWSVEKANEIFSYIHLKEGFTFNTSSKYGVYVNSKSQTIYIDGNVTISGADFGVYVPGILNLKGDGTLNVSNTSDAGFSNYSGNERPSAIHAGGQFKIYNNLTVNATGTSAGIETGVISIDSNAILKATGNRAAVFGYSSSLLNANFTILGNKNYKTFTNMTNVADIANSENAIGSAYPTTYHSLKIDGTSDIAKSVTMYKTDKDFLIKYMVNNVETSITDAPTSVSKTGTADLSGVTPATTPQGKVFAGWYTSDDTLVTSINGAVLTDNVTLYAKYRYETVTIEMPTAEGYYKDGQTNKYVVGFGAIYKSSYEVDNFGIYVNSSDAFTKNDTFKNVYTADKTKFAQNGYKYYTYIANAGTSTYYAKAYVVIDGEYYFSETVNATGNNELELELD